MFQKLRAMFEKKKEAPEEKQVKKRYQALFQCGCSFQWVDEGDQLSEICDRVQQEGCPLKCGERAITLLSHVDRNLGMGVPLANVPDEESMKFIRFLRWS